MNSAELKSLIAAYKPRVARQPVKRKAQKPRHIRPRIIVAKPKSSIVRHVISAYGIEPICPRCAAVGFDDWWHVLKDRKSGVPSGRLDCPMCEKSFVIRGVPGDITSSSFGLDQTDILMRKAGF